MHEILRHRGGSQAANRGGAHQIQPLNHIRASQEVYGSVWPTSTGYR
jgi:hypothetical protein